jgi:hypothetical protein
MKLITFERDGRTSYGVVVGAGIVDLGVRLGRDASSRDVHGMSSLAGTPTSHATP